MNWFGRTFALSLGALLLFSGCAEKDPSVPATDSSRTRGIRFGEPATDPERFQSVLSLYRNGIFACSGTVIGERTFLTAAHCVVGAAPADLTVYSPEASRHYAVSNVAIHPRYTGYFALQEYPPYAFGVGAPDLALVLLVERPGVPAMELPGFVPSPLPPLEIVGFGDNEFLEAGVRRSGEVYLFGVTATLLDPFTIDHPEGMVLTLPGSKEQIICGGDSGGPLIYASAAGRQVLGVVSLGAYDPLAPNDCIGAQSGSYTSTQAYGDWIRDTREFLEGEHPARTAYYLDQDLGLTGDGEYILNWGGLQEKWLRGKGGVWYYLLPDGTLNRWAAASNPPTGTTVARLPVALYEDPTLLFAARNYDQIVLDLALLLDKTYGLRVTRYDYWENFLGRGEKWVLSAANQWFVILKDGAIHRWASQGGLESQPVARLTPDFHEVPSRLHAAFDEADPDREARELDRELGLFTTGNYIENWGGTGEKWLKGNDNQWYFIQPSGALFRWHGGTHARGTLVGKLSPAHHENPALLHDAN